jgi:hypothetical protein
MVLEAKIKRIGTGYGILIPKKVLDELSVKEDDVIVIRKIERPIEDIRGILKGTGYKFERSRRDDHKRLGE